MQIYQHVLNTYSNGQKGGKKIELPTSMDKIVQILSEIPDNQILPVIQMVVTCEVDPRVLDAVQKLFKDRALTGKPPAAAKPPSAAKNPPELMATLGNAGNS